LDEKLFGWGIGKNEGFILQECQDQLKNNTNYVLCMCLLSLGLGRTSHNGPLITSISSYSVHRNFSTRALSGW